MANITTPEEAAKIKELESTLDFLKERKTEPEKTPEHTRKPGELSAVDRARASRFAPPTYMVSGNASAIRNADTSEEKKGPALEKSIAAEPVVQAGAAAALDNAPAAADNASRNPVAPAITPPSDVKRPPQTLNPMLQQSLRPALSIEEAQKQGIIAPGSYGQGQDNDPKSIKGDTKEIPVLSELDLSAVPKKPGEATIDIKKPPVTEPIKNPLPVPKRHLNKDMDFDVEPILADMHFDVVDMSGIDYFDVN